MSKSSKVDTAYRSPQQGGGKNSKEVKKPADEHIGENPSGK